MDKKDGLARELKVTYDELRTLGNEIRLQLHLAGMDARSMWNEKLEPRLFSFEKKLENEVSQTTKTALHELRDAMKRFRQGLPKH